MVANLKQKILAEELKTGQRQVKARRVLNNFLVGGNSCYDLPDWEQKYDRPCKQWKDRKWQRCANTDSSGCCPSNCEPGDVAD